MSEKLLSVIVPVYNLENYIEECITSILNQTYEEVEIILVDDGSTDKSKDICKNLTKTDSRIRFVSQKNIGVTAARTRGVELAKGEYVAFVDGDDYIEPDMYTEMMQYIPEYDLVSCGVVRQWSNSRESCVFDEISDENGLEDIWSKMIYDFETSKLQPLTPWLVNKIFKKTIAMDILEKMNKEIVFAEDSVFMYQYILRCNSFKSIKKAFYTYRYRESSVYHSCNKKMLSNINQVYLILEQVFHGHNMYEVLNKQLEKWITFMTLKAINTYMGFSELTRVPQFVVNLEDICDENVIVYGAGQMGQDIMFQLKRQDVNIVAWIDRDYKYYQTQGMDVIDVAELSNLNFDRLIIAVSNARVAELIKEELKALVSEEKLLWKKPMQMY